MKQGFMLIELIIATLIASMVAGVLLAALFQSGRVQTSVDTIIDLSVRVGVVSNQLEKDLSGVFIPVQAQEKKQVLNTPKVSSEKQEIQKEVEKKAPKPIEKIFYSTNKNGQLDTLTFITNNPLAVYVGKDVGVVKPKVVRVQYSLKPENEKKDSYALFRQESMELDVENYKNVTPYEVIGGIKKCTMTFTARIEKKDDKAENPKISYEYKTLNEWTSEQKKEEDKEKSGFPRIPYQVEMKLLLWDKQDKKDKEFTIVCEIPTDFSSVKDKKQPEKPKPNENKEDQSDKNNLQPIVTAQNRTTKEMVTVMDKNGKVVYQAEKNEASMKEVARLMGYA